jgi:hypothetical protein
VITRDLDIRLALLAYLRGRHGDDAETRIVEEMSICQQRARVDVAVVNGHLAGFEIKSAVDRLDRLPLQARYYGQVFDRAVVVCAPRHLDALLCRLPHWWGVWAADALDGAVALIPVRVGEPNPSPSSTARAQLLWREEMLEELKALNAPHPGRASRRDLVLQLVERCPEIDLAARVRQRLRARTTPRHALYGA